MSIIQIVEINGAILAISDRGQLILWDLTQRLVHGRFVFENNVSLLPSQGKIQVDLNSLQGIILIVQDIIIYSKNTVYLTNISRVYSSIRQGKFKSQIQINCSLFLQTKEAINCLAMIDKETIFIGTNTGNLIRYNLLEKSVSQKLNFSRESGNQDNELLIFSTVQKQNIQVTSFTLYSENSLALVTTSTGKVFSVRVPTLQTVYQLTSTCKQPLQFINKLVLDRDENKFYCLHQSYITHWSIQLNSCLEYYEYSHPQSVLRFKDQLLIAGPHSSLLCLDQTHKQLQLSMRSARILTGVGESMIAVGGSQCLIDMVAGGVRIMTLFSK